MPSKLIVFRSDYVFAMGGNLDSELGTPAETLIAAVSALSQEGLLIRAVSRFYVTPCFPAGAGPDYVNAALRVAGLDDPAAVLAILHGIEARFGRVRETRWAGRTLDLDLIAAGDRVLPDAETQAAWRCLPPEEQARHAPDRLILPHPRLQDRGFVLVPMRDVAPDWVHPLLGQSVREMCDALPAAEIAAIRPM
ncbi:2-amino-4-hydroxy-6-hydroxymethyldihydropteridine pyrophosphokinase [Seohaeicola zhoushanensis]|uniref:2-amino-4-hydroxy-6-hydroxymethyldihydropteridine pyrophosphokinase n=2 Tax=Seohaeicola zhoushanensis TaxID=1569283 RepID=A0A8J3H048_9RHOB|nr:2-amino-4-hydroxy-6-hydroxymethyldihydropteridine pyrophosphokinase [Seohaeicola zhoushanensis]